MGVSRKGTGTGGALAYISRARGFRGSASSARVSAQFLAELKRSFWTRHILRGEWHVAEEMFRRKKYCA